MTDTKKITLPKPEKKKVYEFTGRGNFVLVLKNNSTKVITDVAGRVVSSKKIPAIKAEFNNGYWKTENEEAVLLIQQIRGWGKRFFWHPKTEGLEVGEVGVAKEIDKDKIKRGQRQKKAIRNREENGPVLDD